MIGKKGHLVKNSSQGEIIQPWQNRNRQRSPALGNSLRSTASFSIPIGICDVRACPQCDKKMHQRKLPLVIHIEPKSLFSLNKTCRYCPHCDLLIAHQNNVEHVLASSLRVYQPEAVGNDYLIIGTLEKAAWKRGTQQPLTFQETLDALHDFKEVVTFKVTGDWMPPSTGARSSAQA